MKISTKGRYGLRAVIDIAIHGDSEPVSLSETISTGSLSLDIAPGAVDCQIAPGGHRNQRSRSKGWLFACQAQK